MKVKSYQTEVKAVALMLLLTILLLQGCNDDDDSSKREFSIKVTNLTNNQPFSPLTGLIHDASLKQFELGQPASSALETLAESGGNDSFINNTSIESSSSGNGLLMPGSSETLTLSSMNENINFSLLAMLVNTNDGFTGLDSIDLSSLAENNSLLLYAKAYDSGTEKNTEKAEDIPGQSGEGFNAARDDRNFIVVHPGIIGQDDGLASSSLSGSHRFDNPVAKVLITRLD